MEQTVGRGLGILCLRYRKMPQRTREVGAGRVSWGLAASLPVAMMKRATLMEQSQAGTQRRGSSSRPCLHLGSLQLVVETPVRVLVLGCVVGVLDGPTVPSSWRSASTRTQDKPSRGSNSEACRLTSGISYRKYAPVPSVVHLQLARSCITRPSPCGSSALSAREGSRCQGRHSCRRDCQCDSSLMVTRSCIRSRKWACASEHGCTATLGWC